MYQWPKANASWQSERVNALENVIASDETYNFSNMFDDVMDVPTMANTMNNNRKRTFSARLIAASERNQVRELNYNAPTVIDSNNNHPKRMRNDSNYQSQIPKTQTSGLLQTMGKENSSTERNGSAALLRKSNVGDRAGPRVISGSVKTAMDYNKNRSGLDTLYEIFANVIGSRSGKRLSEKIVVLRTGQFQYVLNCVYYDADLQIPQLNIGDFVRCMGRFDSNTGHFRILKLSIADENVENVASRLESISKYFINEI